MHLLPSLASFILNSLHRGLFDISTSEIWLLT